MEGVGADADSGAAPLNQWRHDAWKVFQFYLDKTTPHAVNRWVGTFVLACLYALRVYYVQGFYIVTYGLGIYILNLLIGFLSPLVDPEMEPSDGPLLPTKGSDEFKPFIRRLPEFKFWYAITKAFCVGFVMTFFSMFDVPVFWPILLCYWVVLFVLTMKRQIMHMIKYKYVPLNVGKQKYSGKRTSVRGSSSRADRLNDAGFMTRPSGNLIKRPKITGKNITVGNICCRFNFKFLGVYLLWISKHGVKEHVVAEAKLLYTHTMTIQFCFGSVSARLW